MDKAKVIEKLNDILRHEWTGVAQYAQAGFVVAGLWREVYSKMFHDSATESFGHAKLIGDKIVSLGGVPSIERNQVKQSDNLNEMLQHAFEFESKAVKLYQEALAMSEDNRPLVILLEEILLQEQDGVEHVEKLLREQKGAAATIGSAAAKAG
jgi:bacterioferritin